MRLRGIAVAGIVVLASASAATVSPAVARSAVSSPYALANRCFAAQSSTGRYLAAAGGQTYAADGGGLSAATPLYLKPTGLATYLLYDPQRGMVSDDGGSVRRTTTPGPLAQWRIASARGGMFTVTSTTDGRQLTASPSGSLGLTPRGSAGREGDFAFVADHGCRSFPEARVGAFGPGRPSVNPDGTVFGWADLEFHLTASYRVGGDVIAGEDFDPFGITAALSAARDEREHGPDGTLDVTGNLLHGSPVATTDPHGWPTFAGWPTYDSETNQQTYWVWLERAWRSGLRLVTANVSEDEELCRIEPRRSHSCNEERSIELQVRNLRRLQDYIDAQAGGPGRGFFRIVYSPQQAREVIAAGKLAVVMGVESSDPFGCSEYAGKPRCDRADIDRGLSRWWRLGIRTFFPIHWVNNAFGGAALEGGTTGTLLNLLNKYQTGRYFKVGRCPLPGEGEEVTSVGHYFTGSDSLSRALDSVEADGVPTYPKGKVCNVEGLTKLGRYLIRQMIARHFMIMVDHIGEWGREQVLRIAEREHYPVISPHSDTGGEWVARDLHRLFRGGGLATVVPGDAAQTVTEVRHFARYCTPNYYCGIALGTDVGGFASLPAPDPHEAELRYPFRAYNGVTFVRERVGSKRFDLNTDGVAQYGLMPDLLAEAEQASGGRAAVKLIYRGAEAYLEAWQRASAAAG